MADAPPAPPGEPTAPPPAEPPAQPAGEPPAEPAGGDDLAAVRREAAGYRTRLRDTETERDALRARVDQMERLEVERIASTAGAAVPADVWLLIPSLDELRVDGALNAERTRERIAGILRERPSWRRPTPDYGSGSRGVANGRKPLGLSDLINEERRGR
jgi:hypothetical protein